MSDFGSGYDAFLAISFLVHIGLLLLGIKFAVERMKDKSKKGLSPMDKVVYLNVTGSFLRVLWLISIVNGRGHGTQMFGNVGDACEYPQSSRSFLHQTTTTNRLHLVSFTQTKIAASLAACVVSFCCCVLISLPLFLCGFVLSVLIRIPQVIWLGSLIFIILVWEMLLAQTENMTKSSKQKVKATERMVNMATSALFFFLIPVMIVGSLWIPILEHLGNLALMIVPLYLCVKGLIYSTKLVKLLGGKDGADDNKAKVINTIRRTINIEVLAVVPCIFITSYQMFFADVTNVPFYHDFTLAFWM